jgi:RNA polymerase sigma-70 factor (ECF subfamily)
MAELNEVQLWGRFKAGDKEAFSKIYTTYFNILYHYGFHIVHDEGMVKDAIQNIFVELWKSKDNLSDTDSIKFYLLKVMRRKLYRSIQLEGQYVSYMVDLDDKQTLFSPELEFITQQTNQQREVTLQAAISRLSNRQKEAITLLYIEGLSYSEVADLMSLKVRTVYNLIHTALESLRKQLDHDNFWYVLALYYLNGKIF